jgi:hypothetical protein
MNPHAACNYILIIASRTKIPPIEHRPFAWNDRVEQLSIVGAGSVDGQSFSAVTTGDYFPKRQHGVATLSEGNTAVTRNNQR